MATAKVILSADVAGLKAKIEESKKLLTDLGSVKISDQFSKGLKNALSKDLAEGAKKLEREIGGIQKALKAVGDAGDKAFDDTKIKQQLQSMSEMKRRLKDINVLQNQMSAGGAGGGGGTGGGGGGGGGGALGGIMSMIPGGRLGKELLALVGGTALVAASNRQMRISQERLGVSALTGGANASMGSNFGFSESERRQRTKEIARAVGRDMSQEEINQMVDSGERAQRAFGVTSDTQASLTGALRKTGGDANKGFTKALTGAVNAGLTGSRVTEFLQTIAQGITQMGQGVDINSDSLMGFASALVSLPFFSKDPARAMRAAQSLNKTFQSGDRFQQALVTRTLQETAGGGLSPADIEVRRRAGLFGGGGTDKMDGASGLEGVAGMEGTRRALRIDPNKIIKNLFSRIVGEGGELGGSEQLLRFQSATGLDFGAAKDIFGKVSRDEKLDKVDIDKLKKGAQTPQERLNQTFAGLDKSMALLSGEISVLTETLTKTLAQPISALASALRDLINPQKSVRTESEKFYEAATQINKKRQVGTHPKTGMPIFREETEEEAGKMAGLKAVLDNSRTPAGKRMARMREVGAGRADIPGISRGSAEWNPIDLIKAVQDLTVPMKSLAIKKKEGVDKKIPATAMLQEAKHG